MNHFESFAQQMIDETHPRTGSYVSHFTSPKEFATWYYSIRLPRNYFLKTAPPHASILDVGAQAANNKGQLLWFLPRRPDITTASNDICFNNAFLNEDEYHIGDLAVSCPAHWHNHFDLIIASHVLEHIPEYENHISILSGLLRNNGGIYIEVPTPESVLFLTKDFYLSQDIDVHTANFYDDPTHIRAVETESLLGSLKKAGLVIEGHCLIKNRFLAYECMYWGRHLQKETPQKKKFFGNNKADITDALDDNTKKDLCTRAGWELFGFCQYIYATKL